MRNSIFIIIAGIGLLTGCKREQMDSKNLVKQLAYRSTSFAQDTVKFDSVPTIVASTPVSTEKQVAAKPEPKQVKRTVIVQKPRRDVPTSVVKSSATTTPSTGLKYYIIIGSYGSHQQNDANTLLSQLKAKGYNAELIRSQGRIRVSIASTTNSAEATQIRDRLRVKLDRKDLWVFRQK